MTCADSKLLNALARQDRRALWRGQILQQMAGDEE
jgi:hypothetical protein